MAHVGHNETNLISNGCFSPLLSILYIFDTPFIIAKSSNSCHYFSSPPYLIMYCINLLKMAQLLHLYVCHFFGGPVGHSSPDTEQQRVCFFNVPISGSKTTMPI